MAHKPQKSPTPEVHTWAIYHVGKRQMWLAQIEAENEAAAIELAATEFGKVPSKLIAIRKR